MLTIKLLAEGEFKKGGIIMSVNELEKKFAKHNNEKQAEILRFLQIKRKMNEAEKQQIDYYLSRCESKKST